MNVIIISTEMVICKLKITSLVKNLNILFNKTKVRHLNLIDSFSMFRVVAYADAYDQARAS